MLKDGKDVSLLSDALFYLENATAFETHALQSYAITKNSKWIDIAKKAREMRSKFLYILVPESDDGAERYCMGKHSVGCAMAMKELGNRFLEDGNKKMAEECFYESAVWEALFKIVNVNEDGKQKN